MTLTEIFNKYKTDKGTIGHGEESHNYGPFYEEFLKPLRDKEVTLLEIGILNGNSLRSWRDYFAAGTVVGVDNEPSRIFKEEEERITTLLGDSNHPEQVAKLVEEFGPFDVIIDDGSHRPIHQQKQIVPLLPLLKPGGFYFIEDLHTENLAVVKNHGHKFWGIEYYSDGSSNTTLEFFARAVCNKRLMSRILTQEELQTISEEIASYSLHYPKVGVMQKKNK